jgi:hypothetical protein
MITNWLEFRAFIEKTAAGGDESALDSIRPGSPRPEAAPAASRPSGASVYRTADSSTYRIVTGLSGYI